MCYFNPSASPVDNGNITSDELHIGKTQLEKTIQRHLFQGSALVILCAGDKPGKIGLSVAGKDENEEAGSEYEIIHKNHFD